MKKQKICIIGDGLTGLATTLVLSKLDVKIELVTIKNKKNKTKDFRATAISTSNYNFLIKYLNKKDSKNFYPCKNINLYQDKLDQYPHFMNFSEEKKNLLYLIENKKLKKIFLKKIKTQNNIKIINGEVKDVNVDESSVYIKNKNFYYDLVILCLGRYSKIISRFVGKRSIKDDEKEISFSSLVKHNSEIIDAKQYFLNEGPLAILPLKRQMFSLVWSLKEDFRKEKIDNIKKIALSKLKKIIGSKAKIVITNPMIFPISFKFNVNFARKNTLVLGDSSYNVHPIAGQGFNLIIRDIKKLYEFIKEHQFLGLQLKNSNVLNKFVNSRKPENLLFGLGINLTNKFFRYNKANNFLKEIILKDIDKFKYLKKVGLKISDKGIFN